MHPAQRASLAAPPIILLGIASGLSPFGVTIAVPILADLARQFSAGYGQVGEFITKPAFIAHFAKSYEYP